MDRQVREIADQLVDWYKHHDSVAGMWVIDTHDIPESDLNQLAGMILSKDDGLSAEATGPDNPEWESAMLPALIRAMRSGQPPASQEHFNDVWMSGIRAYLRPMMQRILDERLETIMEDSQCYSTHVMDRNTGVVTEIRWNGSDRAPLRFA